MCSATKFLECVEDELEVVRALVGDQRLHRKLSVTLAVDDDYERQLVFVPARRVKMTKKTGMTRVHEPVFDERRPLFPIDYDKQPRPILQGFNNDTSLPFPYMLVLNVLS